MTINKLQNILTLLISTNMEVVFLLMKPIVYFLISSNYKENHRNPLTTTNHQNTLDTEGGIGVVLS